MNCLKSSVSSLSTVFAFWYAVWLLDPVAVQPGRGVHPAGTLFRDSQQFTLLEREERVCRDDEVIEYLDAERFADSDQLARERQVLRRW